MVWISGMIFDFNDTSARIDTT